MDEKPIAIVIDTNYNEGKKNTDLLSDFRIGRYDDYIGHIEEHDLVEKVHLFLPEVVLKESIRHRIEEIKNCIELIDSQLVRIKSVFSGIPDQTGVVEADWVKYIIQIEDRIRKNAKIIPIPDRTDRIFESIFHRALHKKPPFKGESSSDAGFKDAVIFESMLEYFERKDAYSEVIFFTHDAGFNDRNKEKISSEFFNRTETPLKVLGNKSDNDADPIVYISERFKVDIDFIRYAKGEYLEKLYDEKNGSVVSFEGNLWNIEILKISWPFYIQELREDFADVYVICYANAFKQNDYKHKIATAEVTLHVIFSKDKDGVWHDKDEVVEFSTDWLYEN